MKVIFLDVDGVLNSQDLFEKCKEELVPIDEENVRCLKDIVDATGAKIVLSSSWRYGWMKDDEQVQEECRILVDMLAKYGLEIMDKTEYLSSGRREDEIKDWMECSKEKIENFVILDDGPYDWNRHGYEKHWVRTDFCTGGLRAEHVKEAVHILNKKNIWSFLKIFKKN
jgi:hypothetical protein